MNPIDKLTLIESIWMYLDSDDYLDDEDKDKTYYYFHETTKEQSSEYFFYKMLYSYKNITYVKDMINTLDINNTFEVTNLSSNKPCQVKYKEDFIDYRLDLRHHSPMGFGNGGSSFMQMSLAILAKATNDKEALRYYEDFNKVLGSMLKENLINPLDNTLKIKQIDIIYWLAEQIISNPVKRICKILDLKQKELAEHIHVSDVTVNRWASKSVDVPAPMLRTFHILEENHILKEKVDKVDLILKTLGELKMSY
jgi:DNA-binding transcriptional regulator YiaG